MKRRIIILGLVAIFFSCNRKQKIINKDILGKWKIYATGYETDSTESEYRCNVCPHVIFTDENIGTIIYPSEETEHIKWEIKNDTIIIIKNSDDKNKEFTNGEYQFSIGKKNEFRTLSLTKIGAANYYRLGNDL